MSRYRRPVSQSFSQGMLYAAIGGALTLPSVAAAQDSSVRELPTISVQGSAPIDGYKANEVSSKKFTAPLLDTPRTVNVIPEEVIKDRGATSLQDVLRTTPGITLGSGEGGTPTGDRPFIRGYEASTDIFIDGIRDYARGSHETFNLESVEVIKGPSSAYTGRGGTGGSINLVTKAPRLGNFFEGSAGLGTDGQYRITGDGNVSFTDSAAFRLNVMKMGGDVPGRDVVETDRWGIAPSLAFGLGTPTRVTLSYSHIVNKDTPDWGIPFRNDANPDRIRPIKVDRENFYGRANVDFRENKFDTATAMIEHDLNDQFTVRNTTRYGKSLNHYLQTRPSFDTCAAGDTGSCATEDAGLQFARADRARYRKSESLVNQTDVFGEFTTGALRHSFVAGFEFSKEEISSKAISGLPGADTDSFWNPNPHRPYSYNLTYADLKKDGDIKTHSMYLFDTVELNDRWSVNAGLRYDSFRVFQAESTGRGGVVNPAQSRKDTMWNYQAGVVYKPAHNGSIY
ncbi:MAG TPA: TonB-dependent receptor, partial [Paenalcaligenes sp.]|nr:TonB-dependent receptor [Paenalcaligenes sp.]